MDILTLILLYEFTLIIVGLIDENIKRPDTSKKGSIRTLGKKDA
jgi:hypothetical protein